MLMSLVVPDVLANYIHYTLEDNISPIEDIFLPPILFKQVCL